MPLGLDGRHPGRARRGDGVANVFTLRWYHWLPWRDPEPFFWEKEVLDGQLTIGRGWCRPLDYHTGPGRLVCQRSSFCSLNHVGTIFPSTDAQRNGRCNNSIRTRPRQQLNRCWDTGRRLGRMTSQIKADSVQRTHLPL